MVRNTLDRALQHLNLQVNQLGSLVDKALATALIVLETGDREQAQRLVLSDRLIDAFRTEIEEHAMRLLLLQQPLGGQEVRFLTSVRTIASRLERIGDSAAAIARVMLQIPFTPQIPSQFSCEFLDTGHTISEVSIIQGILAMGKETYKILQRTLQALNQENSALAHYLQHEHDVITIRYQILRRDLLFITTGANAIGLLQSDQQLLERATYLHWVAHKLERSADHCASICEQIVFIHSGVARPQTTNQ